MIVIVQARSGSRRFKNKVLACLNGKPLIWYVIKQVKKAKKVKKIIVAIPRGYKDRKLFTYLKSIKMNIYRGSEKNVAKRILNAANKFKVKNFMRISADSPLIKPTIINECINLKHKFFDYDIITNVFPRTFPSGQSVEIIKTKILEKNILKMRKRDLEHVTTFFYRNYKDYKIINFINKRSKYKLKYSIDTAEDFNKLKHLIVK